jgi:hypothetical protein
MIDDAVGFVDVVQGAIAKTAHRRVIFFPGNVIVSFVQEFHRAVKAAGPVHAGIDRRMIVQILAVVNRGPLDFVDGFVDLVNGVLFFLVHVIGGRQVFEMSAGVAQVRERVQVSRMPSGFVGESECGTESDQKHDYGAMSYGFHSFLEAFRQNEFPGGEPGIKLARFYRPQNANGKLLQYRSDRPMQFLAEGHVSRGIQCFSGALKPLRRCSL